MARITTVSLAAVARHREWAADRPDRVEKAEAVGSRVNTGCLSAHFDGQILVVLIASSRRRLSTDPAPFPPVYEAPDATDYCAEAILSPPAVPVAYRHGEGRKRVRQSERHAGTWSRCLSGVPLRWTGTAPRTRPVAMRPRLRWLHRLHRRCWRIPDWCLGRLG